MATERRKQSGKFVSLTRAEGCLSTYVQRPYISSSPLISVDTCQAGTVTLPGNEEAEALDSRDLTKWQWDDSHLDRLTQIKSKINFQKQMTLLHLQHSLDLTLTDQPSLKDEVSRQKQIFKNRAPILMSIIGHFSSLLSSSKKNVNPFLHFPNHQLSLPTN